jgi:hypothetical protein
VKQNWSAGVGGLDALRLEDILGADGTQLVVAVATSAGAESASDAELVKLAADVAAWRDYEATELLFLPPELRVRRIDNKAHELAIPSSVLTELLVLLWSPSG